MINYQSTLANRPAFCWGYWTDTRRWSLQNYKNYFFHYNAQILGSADFRGQGWEMRPRFSTKYNGVPQSEG